MRRVPRPALPRAPAAAARIYLRPLSPLAGRLAAEAVAAGRARPLAGGSRAFSRLSVIVRGDGVATETTASLGDVVAWAAHLAPTHGDRVGALLDRLSAPRPAIAGVAMDRPSVMGVVNVTPDSFSDGGDFADAASAVAQGRALAAAGAAIVDLGGESTRPGSDPVAEDEEMARVLPVVEALAKAGLRVSIDSRRAAVMRAAVGAGAAMVNDVSALRFDAGALAAVAETGAPVVLMHAQGDPKTMQARPTYDDAPLDVYDFLEARIAACAAAGIERARIVVDPGIGFGKTLEHNLQILAHLSLFHGLGTAILLGVSRKSFIGRLAEAPAAKGRLPGSLAAGLAGIAQGVQMLRVHDAAETVQALAVWEAIADGEAAAVVY